MSPDKGMGAKRNRHPREETREGSSPRAHATRAAPRGGVLIITCQHPECLDTVRSYHGRGPRSQYCPEHSKPKYRMARSRAGIDLRPECCRAQGKGVCKQHRKRREHNYGRDLDPQSVLSATDGATAEEIAAAQYRDALNLGLAIRSPWAAISGMGITWGRERHMVIGQPDLTWDWQTANPEWREGVEDEFLKVNAKLVTMLVWRGPEWPFAAISPSPDMRG